MHVSSPFALQIWEVLPRFWTCTTRVVYSACDNKSIPSEKVSNVQTQDLLTSSVWLTHAVILQNWNLWGTFTLFRERLVWESVGKCFMHFHPEWLLVSSYWSKTEQKGMDFGASQSHVCIKRAGMQFGVGAARRYLRYPHYALFYPQAEQFCVCRHLYIILCLYTMSTDVFY